MPLEGSYAIWNNRGGSGKTTLTYHLANKFALKNPDKTILLIDMCPQTDLSHALLGDDEHNQDYVSQIGTMKKDPMVFGEQKFAKTVSGYLDLYSCQGLPGSVDPRTFLLNVSKFNAQLPRNLYLLCGDASIELIARSLDHKRNQTASVSPFGAHAWKSITTSLKQFIAKIAERKGIKLVAFIDVQSSCSIISEIGLAACDKLLIPITDDHLHRNGFEYMFALLYGFSQPSSVYYYHRHFSFYYRAKQYDVKLPKIHLILNKSHRTATTKNNQKEWEFIFEVYKKHPQAFNLAKESLELTTLEQFKSEFVISISEETSANQIVRQAVRSHSPLLTPKKNSNTNNNNNSNNGSSSNRNSSSNLVILSTSSSSRLKNPKIVRSASPSPNTRNASLPNVNANCVNKSSDALNENFSLIKQDCLSLNSNLLNEELSMYSQNEQTNAILYDEVLDKIVSSLDRT
ncbi:chromosome partitioning ATPase [Brachionus plicatilis]|uniref:Chromosome partitioning ATPase n=1 Tax=Brachionus plicatilis TaxID=10195 RepID=A0A3M7T515_BRAPC|nr:chromosome partitioning ATPase [Brachionus plicatilis]